MKLALLALGMLLTACLLWAGQQPPADNSPQETLVKEMLAAVDEITKILKSVQDTDSAAAARPELKKNADKITALQKQAAEGKQPSAVEKERLEKEYVPKMEAAVKKFQDETLRVKGIQGGKEVLEELPIFQDRKDKSKDSKKGD